MCYTYQRLVIGLRCPLWAAFKMLSGKQNQPPSLSLHCCWLYGISGKAVRVMPGRVVGCCIFLLPWQYILVSRSNFYKCLFAQLARISSFACQRGWLSQQFIYECVFIWHTRNVATQHCATQCRAVQTVLNLLTILNLIVNYFNPFHYIHNWFLNTSFMLHQLVKTWANIKQDWAKFSQVFNFFTPLNYL